MISQKQPCRPLMGGVLPLLLLAGMTSLQAAPPLWWSAGTVPVLNANAANNGGPANVGQAKWVAKNALAAVQSQDAALAALIEADLVGAGKPLASWAAPVTAAEIEAQKAPLLVGQLKAITAPFYNHLDARVPGWLAAERAANQTETHDGIYPWTDWSEDDGNGGIATLGQLKACFALHFTDDADADSVPDFKEWLVNGSADSDDFDGDGVTNLQEITQGTNPAESPVAMTGGLPNDWLTFTTGKVAVYPPVAKVTLQPGQTAPQLFTIRNNTGVTVPYSLTVTNNTVDNAYSVAPYVSPASPVVTGTLLDISTAGDEVAFPTGFSFPFFGTNYSSVYVNTDGVLSFGSAVSVLNTALPNTTQPALIAAFWEELSASRGFDATTPKIQVAKSTTSVTIRWHLYQVPDGLAQPMDIYAQLFPDGRIRFYYERVNNPDVFSTGATIGIQSANGGQYVRMLNVGSPATARPRNNRMLEFSPKSTFFTLDPGTATTVTTAGATLNGQFSAVTPPVPAGFVDGVYTANLHFNFGASRPAVDTRAVLTVKSAPSTLTALTASPAVVTAGGSTALTVTATDSLGVQTVEFTDGATSLGTVPGVPGPYSQAYTLNSGALARGQHHLKAKVTNTHGGVTYTAVTVLTVADAE